MARIKCHYMDCVFLDEGLCSAAAIELDPDTGCATYSPTGDAAAETEWEEEELDEWDDEDVEEDDEEWLDEEEDEF